MPASFQLKNEPRNAKGEWSKTGMVRAIFKGGKHILESGKPMPAHLAKVRIPPAWTEVKIHLDPNAKVWAMGRDVKGRSQSIYNPQYRQDQDLKKFARMQALERKFEQVHQTNEKNRSHPELGDAAEALKLILHTGIRPGSDRETGAATKAYGATTLLGKHVREGGARLQFTGKKGVPLDIPITDKGTQQMLASRAKKAGANGKLFPNTNTAHLRKYAKSIGGEAKPKDFRTLLANRTAKEEVTKRPLPKNEKEFKRAVKEVATVVSQKLGNTPAISLKSYINPRVFDKWKEAF